MQRTVDKIAAEIAAHYLPKHAVNESEIEHSIRGKVVLVTGAGGSIGSELCRQVLKYGPKELVEVERCEYALYAINSEIGGRPVLGDVTDKQRMSYIISEHKPNVIFHAAAHKHIPMCECNPGEAIKNNVDGTRTIADLAHVHGVEKFVGLSTDKAVNPCSIMGATKRLAEMYVQAIGWQSVTKYACTRFGNVLGSSGSVLPKFVYQIEHGLPLTITDKRMVRYFMSIPQAVSLVLQAGAYAENGEVFIFDMGQPVAIENIARLTMDVLGLHVPIEFVGARAGEKLFESLAYDSETMDKTSHVGIYVGKMKPSPLEGITAKIDGLVRVANTITNKELRTALRLVVPEFGG